MLISFSHIFFRMTHFRLDFCKSLVIGSMISARVNNLGVIYPTNYTNINYYI